MADKRWKTIKKFAYLMHVINYIPNVKIKIESTHRRVPLECHNGFRKVRSCNGPLFCKELFIKKIKKFNLEILCEFSDYVEGFHGLKREKLFEISQIKIFPIYY